MDRAPIGSAAALLALALLLGPPTAAADPVACQRTILKESVKLASVRVKALGRCEDRKRKGALAAGTDCATEAKTAGKIARAESRLATKLARACGGPDRTCGTGDDESLAAIGWPASCPDFLGLGCANAIAGCDDVAACLTCVDREAAAQAIGLAYDALAPAGASDVARCQRTIGKETARLFDARAKALRTCWDARHKGAHANACPTPGDGKAAPKLATAASKARAKICRACGGDDRACGGGDDLPVAAIGFPEVCPAGDGCAAAVGDLDALADCAGCVTAFDVDCVVPLAVPALAPYPAACAPAAGACPTRLQLDGEGDTLDLDLGWSGNAHDVVGPWLGRLSLAVFGCTGGGDPACGSCDLAGPIENAGGAAFATRRCAEATWVACAADSDCPGGPCRFLLGPPHPVASGGLTSCVQNEITGPVTGTVDVESGAVALTLPLRLRPFNLQFFVPGETGAEQPCPRCVAGVCDSGPRAGMACTVQGHSALFDDDLSLDCPPPDEHFEATTVVLPLATGAQALTLEGASPACQGVGFTGLRCMCDTCNHPGMAPCHTHADCPESPPGTPGICGGLRCLSPAGLLGTPCGTPADCGGGICGAPGVATKPNACASGSCSPTAGGEGACATGPFDGSCEPAEPFRSCSAASDCPAPGDACVFTARDCYPDDGLLGASVVATGAPDVPAGGTFAPGLAGLACVPPTGSFYSTIEGLPGLGRATIDVTALLD